MTQVGGAVAGVLGPVTAAGRVASATGLAGAAAALVEWQKAGVLAGQPRGHHHRVGIDGEVDHRPAAEQHVGRVAVGSVLGHGVVLVLAGERVLQLGGGHGQAVDEQGEIERPVGVLARVVDLADDGEAVGGVAGLELRVEAGRRSEVGEPQQDAEVLDAVAKDVDGAPTVQLAASRLAN